MLLIAGVIPVPEFMGRMRLRGRDGVLGGFVADGALRTELLLDRETVAPTFGVLEDGG